MTIHGLLIPLVFSFFGGMRREWNRFFWQTSERLNNKIEERKSMDQCMEKARLNFTLI